MSTIPLRRGMWVWNGYAVASSPIAFVNECRRIKITDVYLYFTVGNYTKTDILRKFIRNLSTYGIKAWGIDGARKYYRDASGPAGLYASINALIAYNSKVSPVEKFYGFQTDNEPDNYSGKWLDTFHNDIETSNLSKTSGGVFKTSAYEDRMFILQDWIGIQSQCTVMLRKAGLKSGAALPTWLEDYYGEPLTVTVAGKNQTVMEHMFNYIDEYCIMSYQTDLTKVSQRIINEIRYANNIPDKKVFAGVETVTGRGGAVTYGDNAAKKYKSAVIKDIEIMEGMFKGNPSFGGVNIHDWQGWMALAN